MGNSFNNTSANIHSLEHTNLTVRDPAKLANQLCAIFNWSIRWSGDALNNGFTVHVGNEQSYLALYQPPTLKESNALDDQYLHNLNHLGVVVDDLGAIEAKVREQGWQPFGHREYAPGKRFYFKADDALEFEVISYA